MHRCFFKADKTTWEPLPILTKIRWCWAILFNFFWKKAPNFQNIGNFSTARALILNANENECRKSLKNIMCHQYTFPLFHCFLFHSQLQMKEKRKIVGNKAKGRISKRIFQENKAQQNFSENLACFVFLKHPFWDLPFYLITDKMKFKKKETYILGETLSTLQMVGWLYGWEFAFWGMER